MEEKVLVGDAPLKHQIGQKNNPKFLLVTLRLNTK